MAMNSPARAQSPRAPGSAPLHQSDLHLPVRRGKVRDVYELPDRPDRPPALLIVASDRLSAFDVVLPTPIPGKGRLLTEISMFWFRFIRERNLSPTHVISADAAQVPDSAFRPGGTTRVDLEGRITIGRRCRVVPIECVARGYLEGSGWKDYQKTGAVCGVRLPRGLAQCQRLPEPIFTPATKAPQGQHDENITFERACELVGRPLMETLRERTLAIYRAASEHAAARGILVADTKFEFGIPEDNPNAGPILIDEALTPDSSRFWPADRYAPGRAQVSFDKQYVREHLERLVAEGRWDKQAPGPELPEDVVRDTLAKYAEARDRLLN
jgi:phosphoribosylaminoimidazole-succinocarboxamide synthase